MRTLEKIIRDAISSNKYKKGIKEVKSTIKGSKLIVLSNSVAPRDKKYIENQALEFDVPIFYLPDNSIKLGRLFNKPFKISTVSLKNTLDEELQALLQTQ